MARPLFASLALLVHLSGQISLCHAAFVAVGATTFSHLTHGLGVPWVVAETFADTLNRRAAEGVFFRPVVFEPTFHKHARESCGGCEIHVRDRRTFRPVESAVALLEAFRAADPARFGWRQPPYEYEHDRLPIDVLAGSPQLRITTPAGAATSAPA